MSVYKRLAIVAFLGLSGSSFGMEPTPDSARQGQPGDNTGEMHRDKASLDDAEIMGLLDAVHRTEIEQARYVLDKSRNLNVKKYAQSMIDAHSGMASADRDMAADHQSPEVRGGEMADGGTQASPAVAHSGVDSNAKQRIVDAGREHLAALKAATGPELDRLYVQSAIDGHQKVLDIIDGKLVASVQSPDVRARLLEMRPATRQHLDDAQRLKANLATSTVPTGSK